jgi:predicted amidohydrolase YtcJ
VTHEYVILTGGIVLPDGADAPRGRHRATAIAWAEDTILAIGSDAAVRAVSRGDSHFSDLRGAFVVPVRGRLEAGGPADMAVLDGDPAMGPARTIAVLRGGHVVEGELPGLGHGHGGPDQDA